MLDFDDFFAFLDDIDLGRRAGEFQRRIDQRYRQRPHGEHGRWQAALDALPRLDADATTLAGAAVAASRRAPLDIATRTTLQRALTDLCPWRKGPFDLFGIAIDSEWRSNRKWDRVAPHISELRGRRVLDVGCGNGYYLWRMAGAGARAAIGIDPSQLFLCQFRAVARYLDRPDVHLLPLGDDDLPADLGWFDSVFSMGVLYHRRSPAQHLAHLRGALRRGGELILETLVIERDDDTVFAPPGRYAQMPNVRLLPSPTALLGWLERAGFEAARIVDITPTTTDEQRATPWMQFESLADFLDPDDPSRTVEGYPAPVRAIAVARRPA